MFKSAHHALQFVFRTLGMPIVKMSSVNSMRGASGSGDMTPHDRHAQAAMIMAIVERAVDVNGIAYLKAYYGRELQKGTDERAVADVLVRVAMSAMPTGMHSRRGVEKLVRIYFGQGISMVSARTDFKCRHAVVNEYKKLVHDAMDTIGRRAEDAAYTVLDDAGLISIEEAA